MDDHARAEAWKSRAQYEESRRLVTDAKLVRVRMLLLDALEVIGDVRDAAAAPAREIAPPIPLPVVAEELAEPVAGA